MNFKEIENYFENVESLNSLLDSCLEMFDRIDKIAEDLRNRLIDTPDSVRGALQELGGIFCFLNPIYHVAKTVRQNIGSSYFNSKKIEIENKGEKFTAAAVEREEDEFVGEYRRVRNILQAYVENCDKNIGSLQSISKSFTKEDNNA